VPDSDLQGVILQWLDEHGTDATPRLASDVLKCTASEVRVPFDVEPPMYLGEHGNSRPNWIAMQNGLLNLDDVLQGEPVFLRSHTPRWFSTFALPYDYDPNAKCDVWFQTLDSDFGGDEERANMIAEVFGYCLTTDTMLHKIPLLQGPKRSGKGAVLRTLKAVVGESNCFAIGMKELGQRFALSPLLGKRVAIDADAHLGHGEAALLTLERLAKISGEDAVYIDRKGKEPITARLPIVFVLAVNELLKFDDPTGKLESRVRIIPFRNCFEGKEDRALEPKILTERSGIFNWAIEGLIRLRRQGDFTRPAVSREVEAEFGRLSSPIKGFLEDFCVIRADEEVSRDTLYVAYVRWCAQSGHNACSRDRFGAQLRGLVLNLNSVHRREDGTRIRYYVGLGLRTGVEVQ